MNTSAAHERNEAMQGGIQAWKPLLAFTLFTLVIGMTGTAVFQRYKEDLKSVKLRELGSIADMKLKEMARWVKERKGDARSLTEASFFLDETDRWLRRGGPADKTREKLAERLALLQQAYAGQGYTEITLFDTAVVSRLSTSATKWPLDQQDRERLLESMRSGQIIFSDIHVSTFGPVEEAEIELVAPLVMDKGSKARAIGAILFRIDPRPFLFPFIQQWPISGTTAENMIVRREGNEVVYLSTLRHLDSQNLFLRLPLNRQQLLAAKALSGEEGMFEGVDYRGVPSIAVLSRIAGTSWYLISKIDRDEVFGPINRLARWVVALSLVFFGTGCGIFFYWWKKQRQHIRLLQAQQETEAKYHRMFELAQEGIWVIDADSITTMVNPAMARMLGYAQEDMLGRHLFSFMDEQGKKICEQNLVRRRNGIEEQHDFEFVRSDGTRIYTAVATAPIMDSHGIYRGAIAGVMDITERKRSEARLAQAYGDLQQLSSHLDTVREEERKRIARELHDEMGATLASLKMRVAWLAARLPAGDAPVSEEMGHISGLVSDGIRTMRRVVTELRPSVLEDIGFTAALEDCVEKLRSQTGAECKLAISVGEAALNPEQSATLFRITQEALNNVAKHAKARHVDISLSERKDALVLVVQDDGVGFAQETAGKSFGLIGIRERALMMGGEARISSVPGKGTCVTVSMPAANAMAGKGMSESL